jgi:hypothetical protein
MTNNHPTGNLRNVSDFKEMIRNASKPSLGKFGEKIYCSIMLEAGYEVNSLHEQRADFWVAGIGRVDVKTKGLGRIPTKLYRRMQNTYYCLIDLYENEIQYVHEDENSNRVAPQGILSWQQAFDYWSQERPRLSNQKSELKSQITEVITELRTWILNHWNMKAAVVYREGMNTQESMTSGRNPWGPVTFYENPMSRRKIDLKILIYFEGSLVYRVFAYPMSHIDKIEWTKGRTKENTVSFDPKKLNTIFQFTDIQDFKCQFPHRFLTPS